MNETNQRAKMREERIRQIQDVTKQLVLKESFGANLMSRIAKECGISRQRLYCYYDSQEAILSDIHDSCVHRLADTFASVSFPEEPKDINFLDMLPRAFASNDDFMFLAIYEVYRKKNGLPYSEGPLDNTPVFQEMLERAQKAGLVRKDFSAAQLDFLTGQLLYAFYFKAMMLQDLPEGKLLLDDRVVTEYGRFIQSFLSGDNFQNKIL